MRRVLVVDDDGDYLTALRGVLDRHAVDVEVLSATGVEEALLLAEAHPPDVAVLDVRMPEGGGLRLVRELRARLGDRPRIVAMSAYDDSAERDRLRAAGAQLVLRKEDPLESLLDAIG